LGQGIVCAAFVLLATAGQMAAQKSDAAAKRAGSWFDKGESMTRKINRLHALQKSDMDMYETAFTKASLGDLKRADIGFAILQFNVLFDAKDQVLPGAVIRYSRRIEQLPAKVIEQWENLTGADSIHAAMSLTAEADLFPQEKFSGKAFQVLASKFK
jgi:hypothetical protein